MNCPHCGNKTSGSQTRCTSCGRSFAAVGTSVLTPPPVSPDEFIKTALSNPNDMTRPPGAHDSNLTAGPLAIGQQFGPRYRILTMLGIGGMGAVYQAWDHELDVVVALKVIRPEATSDPADLAAIERRFKQELLLARQVTHKNVVRIHDLGEIDGIKYLTMSYIQGADLATVLQRDGALTVPVALNITRQIAAGLLAAHEAGVVHRDLKPANIMIEGDHAIIMDFGIARSAGSTAPATPPELPSRSKDAPAQTMLGAVVGTITYMSPEQARGEPVDQRADMYALGLIISDMLLGLGRRSGISADDDLVRRMVKRPEPLRNTNPDIPEALDQIVTRLVEPDPKARFQTTAELAAALKRLDDNGVPLPLIQRLTPRLIATAATVVIALLAATFYFTRGGVVAPVHHDPVSVLVADFQNNTHDAAFDGVIESTVKRALEGAGFVTAYDRIGLRSTIGVDAPGTFDEAAARDIAAQQGLGIVVAGSIGIQGSGYALSIKAVQVSDGTVIATSDRNADSKDNVLTAATRLAAAVRTALGDEAKESVQLAAMPGLSATPLNVVREYVQSLKAPSTGNPDEARRYLDVMTEREKFRARGSIAQSTGDYQQCVKEYGDLIKQFEAEVVGRYQRAQCLAQLRDMDAAVTDMRHVVESLPGRMLFHTTLARYASYAGEIAIAEEEAGKLPPAAEASQRVLAMSQVGQDLLADASGTYEKLRAISPLGASIATAGLGDIAIAQGRFADAARILEQGALADQKSGNAEAAASEYALLAYAELSRGRNQLAVLAAEKALAASQSVKIRFLAARTLIEAGAADKARPLIDALAAAPQAEAQAHAQILEGELALKNGDARQAIKLLMAANAQLDTWIGRFELGRANFAAGAFVQADSEIDRCITRRGEALSLFIDEDPSFGYFPAVYFYKGRIREALNNAGFTESYKKYLAYRGQSKDDPLVAEVRKKAGS